jgi:hypothetical protein
MLRHTQVHTERRDYHCRHCGKSFKRSTHLRRHILSNVHQAAPPPSSATSVAAAEVTVPSSGEDPLNPWEGGGGLLAAPSMAVKNESAHGLDPGEGKLLCATELAAEKYGSAPIRYSTVLLYPIISSFFIPCTVLQMSKACLKKVLLIVVSFILEVDLEQLEEFKCFKC